jgi:hypothetical protein
MDYRGYSKRIIDANAKANTDSLGVLLGRYCISRDISAMEIAVRLKVSRMTIYRWFTGEWEPRPQYEDRIKKVIKEGKEQL